MCGNQCLKQLGQRTCRNVRYSVEMTIIRSKNRDSYKKRLGRVVSKGSTTLFSKILVFFLFYYILRRNYDYLGEVLKCVRFRLATGTLSFV